MFAIVCRRRLWIPPKGRIFLCPQFLDPQSAVFAKLFSSKISSPPPGVCRNASEKSFTASYLISSCGLSSKDALSLSEKVRIKSSKKPDAVLELFRKYGFTNADITRLVSKWPLVLNVKPEKTLLPKLEFFSSIDIPPPVLAEILSFNPAFLDRSLKNSIIPGYNYLKSFVRSDERRLRVLSQTIWDFKSIPPKIALLREEGLPESSIGHLLSFKPLMIRTRKEKIAACVRRAAEMGIDKNKLVFTTAVQVFIQLSESTLKHKMEVYRRCGWSESDINVAFSRFPLCMKMSEKKIMANTEFLVNTMGFKPAAVARFPAVVAYSLEKRMKPRYLVAKMLDEKGLKKMTGSFTFLIQGEELFLKNYVVPYQCHIPKLLDIYQGRLSECAQEEIEKT